MIYASQEETELKLNKFQKYYYSIDFNEDIVVFKLIINLSISQCFVIERQNL